MSVKIGDGNKIKNSTIAGSIMTNENEKKKGFCEKHPIICGLLISLTAGIILLFSFWQNVVKWIEGVL